VRDFFWDEQMDLPDDIRLRIDNSRDKDVIMEVVTRLQSEGVTITQDVIAAIVATLQITEGVIE
jgi:spore coat polysaccharide biosynthesis protein SpsF (cytidylyltransferase family)